VPDNEYYADDRDQDASDDNRPLVSAVRNPQRSIAVPEPDSDVSPSVTLESVEVSLGVQRVTNVTAATSVAVNGAAHVDPGNAAASTVKLESAAAPMEE